MTAPRVRADYEILGRIAQAFAKHASDARQNLQRIQQQVDTLQGGDWVGKGASAFYQEMNASVVPSFNRLIRSLEQAGQDTKKMSDIMKRAEEEAARIFKMDGAGGPVAAGAGAATGEAGGEGGAAAATTAAAQAKMSRDQAKKAAANASVAMNKMAAVCAGGAAVFAGIGIASAVTGVGAVVGVGGVVACGLCSAAAWWMSADYQQLANDPPREDFDKATKFEPPQFKFKAPEDAFEAAWQDLTRLLATQSAAMKALVTSLERYDGVQAAMKKTDGDRAAGDEQRGHALAQAEAIAHNAAACADAADGLLDIRDSVNDAWQQMRESLVEAQDAVAGLSPEDLQASFSQIWDENRGSLQTSLGLSESDMADLGAIVDQQRRAQPPTTSLPETLFDDEWSEAIRVAAAQLRGLSDSYGRLKGAIQSA